MRKIILKVHLLLSTILGLFIVAICTTGSLLVLEDDIEKLLHPIQIKPTSGHASLHTMQRNTAEAYPGYQLTRVDFPGKEGLYRLTVGKKTGGKTVSVTALVDPGSGQVAGNAPSGRQEPFITIFQLHHFLLAGDIIGRPKANIIVGITGLALTVILLTGMYLWWPSLRKWASGFIIRRNRGKLALNQGLHKLAGIVTLPLLLMFAVTGSAIVFDKNVFDWFGAAPRDNVPPAAAQSKAISGETLPLDRVIDITKRLYPDALPKRIQLPQNPGQSYQIVLKEGYSPNESGNTTVYLDSYSGEVLYKTNPKLGINQYNAWKRALHYAAWGGPAFRTISFVIGMMPLFLMVTGLAVWRLKARARSKHKAAAAAKANSLT